MVYIFWKIASLNRHKMETIEKQIKNNTVYHVQY